MHQATRTGSKRSASDHRECTKALSVPPNPSSGAHRNLAEHSETEVAEIGLLGRLLLASGVLGLAHATKAATSAPSRALPRRRALCTNWKTRDRAAACLARYLGAAA